MLLLIILITSTIGLSLLLMLKMMRLGRLNSNKKIHIIKTAKETFFCYCQTMYYKMVNPMCIEPMMKMTFGLMAPSMKRDGYIKAHKVM